MRADERTSGAFGRALPTASALVEALFAQSPFGTALYDGDGRLAAGNPAYARHWGIGLADVPPDYSLFTDPQLARSGLIPLIRRAFDGEHVVLPPVRYDAAAATGGAGRVVWTQGHCYPVRGHAGTVTHVAITFVDVTAHTEAERAAQAARSRLEAIVERLPAPTAIVVGPALTVIAANDSYRQLVGGRRLLGCPLGDALPELVAPAYIALLERVRDTGTPYRGEGIPVRWDRHGRGEMTDGVVDVYYEPLSASDDSPPGVVIQVIDRTGQANAGQAAEAARDRTERLQALTAALAATYTPEDVADVVVAQGVAVTGAATGRLALRASDRRDELVVLRQTGLPGDVAGEYVRFPVTAGVPTAACVRTGEPIFLESGDAVRAHFPEMAAIWASLGTESLATVPLAVAGETVGAISFTFTGARAFAPGDRSFFIALGRQCAQALERARLFEAEREARAAAERAADRARRLQRLTARLNEAVSREQIADVILEGGLAAVGADAGSLAVVRAGPDGTPHRFEIIRTAGYSPAVTERYRTFPLQPGRPLSEAVLRRQTVLIASPDEWHTVFPAATEDLSELGFRAFAGIPALVGDRVLAAVSFSFRAPQAFDDAARTFLATLGEQCALALERARLHDAELRLAERHAALLETIEDAFVAFDGALCFTYVNARAEALLRRPAAELLGRRLEDVLPRAVGGPIFDAIRRTLETRQGTQVEAESAIIDGWIEARLYPAPDGVSLVFQDVSARKRAQDAAALLAEVSRVLSASLDYETTLRAVAEAAVPRLGDWCAVDVVQDPTARAWPPRIDRLAVVHQDPAMLALAAELRDRYPTDWSAEVGMAAVVRDGAPLYVPVVTEEMMVAGARDAEHLALIRALRFSSVIVVPLIARGLTLGALTLCMTESGRHYDEADLALARNLAERAAIAVDNARLYREAERARAEAEAANRAKSQFLATMSHELRTPLNAIGGYAELLAMGIRGPVTAQQAEDLERIQRSQRHLLGLINEVLNYARVETGVVRYDIEDVGVRGAIGGVHSLILPQVRDKALVLATAECDPGLTVRADAEKLRQILLNLLSNAVKFTPNGGRITLRCRATDGAGGGDAGAGGRVEITVTDTGVGIPGDQLEAIFEPFVQVGRALNSPGEGAGLGLAISRDLARGMGGDLTVESVVGGGSTFTLVLPRGTGDARAAPGVAR